MNITYASNFTTNLSCSMVDNINYCTGQIAVVPYNQDLSIVLQGITAVCLVILVIIFLARWMIE